MTYLPPYGRKPHLSSFQYCGLVASTGKTQLKSVFVSTGLFMKMAEIAQENSHCHDEEDAHPHAHVHFPEDQGPNTDIQVIMKGKKAADVHVGFLQHKHKYDIELKLPEAPSTAVLHSTPSPFVCICDVKSLGDGKGLSVHLHLDGHKEGLQRDKFTLKSDVTDDELLVVLHARVLGSKKGTPMLKDCIKCIHVEKDEDEGEHSDWKGFE